MPVSQPRVREYLRACDFRSLFIEELGWDNPSDPPLPIPLEEESFTLRPIAEKRGFSVFLCSPCADGSVPPRALRMRIDKETRKLRHEHMIVYTDESRENQIWQWVKREPGKPTANREHHFHLSQDGVSLAQKLASLAFSRHEEKVGIKLTDVLARVEGTLDVERVTRRFYTEFRAKQQAFLAAIGGIPADDDREWYASLMLNRLMFVYFIQRKGFLDGDQHYLTNRLRMVQEARGSGHFLSFYRCFLLHLFHDGLGGRPPRDPEIAQLLGRVPYLNGGFFEVHQLEREYPDIDIPDEAFEAVFSFFDQYEWHLDRRPMAADREIDPSVLGFIFEKYINQKQMGAYYTQEDITEYIGKNTILPHVLDSVARVCRDHFAPDGPAWSLLTGRVTFSTGLQAPDRYIYEPVRRGVDLDLPDYIAAGLDSVPERGRWNEPAAADFALPTETWREHVARRTRCHEVRAKLGAGEVHETNDLITLNLDIRLFAQDVVERCDDPAVVRAFWKAISTLTVLDPTVGSGAFLFAALNILQPLYEACLDRMEAMVADLDRSEKRAHPEKLRDFREVLADVAKHPNRAYYILKSIIVNNLYGVDIMDEAVEICKLRLFLKLVAEVDTIAEVEPLPDIDFNIQAGNTLVGYATLDQVRAALSKTLDFDNSVERITERAEAAARAFEQFRLQQTTLGGTVTPQDKADLRQRLQNLSDELDQYLAREYGVDLTRPADLAAWKESHKPFHWCVEFYAIVEQCGGFDVTIGNPPYVEYSKVRGEYRLTHEFDGYATNLYSACCYRAACLKSDSGRAAFIVPVSLPSTDRLQPLRKVLACGHSVHFVSFSTRPCKLFAEAEQRLTIYIQSPAGCPGLYSGGYRMWLKEERETLFERLELVALEDLPAPRGVWCKADGRDGLAVLRRLLLHPRLVARGYVRAGSGELYYKKTGIRYFNTVSRRGPKCWINGVPTQSSRETTVQVPDGALGSVHCLLLSTTFFLFWQATTNCRDLNPSDIDSFTAPDLGAQQGALDLLSLSAEDDYTARAEIVVMNNKRTGRVEVESLTPARSKPVLDLIDRALAQRYGFTDEELDFIINYDIKYRMGSGGNGGADGDE